MDFFFPPSIDRLLAPDGKPGASLLKRAAGFFDAAESGDASFVAEQLAAEPLLGRALRQEYPESAACSALWLATDLGSLETARALIPFSDPFLLDGDGLTPFFFALRLRRLGIARELFPLSDPKATDYERNAALSAAAHGDLELLREAVKVCDPNARDGHGRDAMILAAINDEPECARFLLDFCDPEAVDLHGDNALHEAVMCDNAAVVDALLPRFDARRLDSDGRTPLMLAVDRSFCGIAQRLLPVSDLSALDKRGLTAFEKALRHGNASIVDVFAPFLTREQMADAWAYHGQTQAAAASRPERLPRILARLEALEMSEAMESARRQANAAQPPAAARKPRAL